MSKPKHTKLSLVFYGRKIPTIEAFLDILMLEYPNILGFEKSKKPVPVNPWFLGPSHIYYLFFETVDQAKEFAKDEEALKSYHSFLGIEKKAKKKTETKENV